MVKALYWTGTERAEHKALDGDPGMVAVEQMEGDEVALHLCLGKNTEAFLSVYMPTAEGLGLAASLTAAAISARRMAVT